jgi:hypothetical protein
MLSFTPAFYMRPVGAESVKEGDNQVAKEKAKRIEEGPADTGNTTIRGKIGA